MRAAPRDGIRRLLEGFDAGMRALFQELVGREVGDAAWAQTGLPSKMAGVGLRSAMACADASYLASRMGSREACSKLDSGFVWEGRGDISERTCLGAAEEGFNQLVGGSAAVDVEGERVWSSGELNKLVDQAGWDALWQAASQWDRVRLLGLKEVKEFTGLFKLSRVWLEGVPSGALDTRLSNEEFSSRVGRRLGVELNEEGHCPFCFQVMDVFGAHSECCMAGGDRVLLHNEQRDTLHRQAGAAGARPELESSGLLAGLGEPGLAGRRPADTLLCSAVGVRTAKGRRLPRVAVDLGFVCPQATSHVVRAGEESLRTATDYTERKRVHGGTDRRCEEAQIDYQPCVFETFGGGTEEAVRMIESLNKLVAVKTHTPHREVAHRLWHRMSVDLQRALHRAWVRRVGTRVVPRASWVSRALAGASALTFPEGRL